MNCEQVRDGISGFVDGNLSSILHQAICHHMKRCERCSLILDQEQLLVEQLANVPIPEPRSEFFPRALKNARDYHQKQNSIDIPYRFVYAVACFLLGVCLTVAFQGRSFDVFSSDSPLAKGVDLVVSENEQLDIHLQVSVNSDIDDATMTIEVPSSLKIVGFEDLDVLQWQIALKKGNNVLALPVKARRLFTHDQVSHLVARLDTGLQKKDYDIKVTIKSSQSYRQGAFLDNTPLDNLHRSQHLSTVTLSVGRYDINKALLSAISV